MLLRFLQSPLCFRLLAPSPQRFRGTNIRQKSEDSLREAADILSRRKGCTEAKQRRT